VIRVTYTDGKVDRFEEADGYEGYAPGHEFLSITQNSVIIARVAKHLVRKIETIEKGELIK
jgi:hypothetical protein